MHLIGHDRIVPPLEPRDGQPAHNPSITSLKGIRTEGHPGFRGAGEAEGGSILLHLWPEVL